MSPPLLPASFLFRFSVPCRYRSPLWTEEGADLDESFRLIHPAELDGRSTFAEFKIGWSERGLAFSTKVEGKRQALWCRETRPDESDGVRLWIDTRDTHNIHRAGRFCHQFIFMPAGAGRALDEPAAEQILINRARENAKPVRSGMLEVRRAKRADGYLLEGFIPAGALTGFDPVENPRLGFAYAVIDRELGEQIFSGASEFPYREDPSLWATLELRPPK
ncbi:MAG TPA: hypothetical protein VMV69_13440 [Pirellulales bacterium]|nr:hypothetical protein [Pirellulales bacterium]